MSGEERLDRTRELMMAALDGELQAGEDRELQQLLEQNAELREEYRRMKTVKDVTGSLTFREPPEEVWEMFWVRAYNRVERGIGWVLFSLGAIALLGFGAWHLVGELFSDPEVPVVVRWGVLSLLLGTVVLGVSVVRERWFSQRNDPYREVQR